MEQDKINEQFTAWLADQEQEQLEMGNPRFTGTEIGCMGRAWQAAWQASREEVVVVLPPEQAEPARPLGHPDRRWPAGWNTSRDMCRAAIEAAGIRTR